MESAKNDDTGSPQVTYDMNRYATERPAAKKLAQRPGDNITGFWIPINRSREEVYRSIASTKSLLTALDNQNATVEQIGGTEGQVGAMYTTKYTNLTGGHGGGAGEGGRRVRMVHKVIRYTVTVAEEPSVFEYVSEIDGKQTRTRFELYETNSSSCEVWLLFPERTPNDEVKDGMRKLMMTIPCCIPMYPCCYYYGLTMVDGLVGTTANMLETYLTTHTPIQN